MALSVIRSKRSLVTPSQQTPSGKLDLSFIDKIPVLRCYTRTLHVYRYGPKASEVIREALSKALVPYYPLAGRLKDSGENHQLQVECSGEGVWFVEASSADCTLDAFNYFDNADLSIPYDELLPDQVPKSEEGMEPLVQMQVTQFGCGGFVIGLIFCHTICDGLGSAQFLNAVGELARGLEHLSTPPVWQRDFFPEPTHQATVNAVPNLPPPPILPDNRLEHVSIDITMDVINQLKQEFHESTGKACSTFEIVAANCWSLRTRAINLKPDTEVRLLFFANCRQLLDPPLPKGFYGNCFFPITISAPCEFLTKVSEIEVIKLIQEAKTKLPVEFAKFKNGDYLRNGKDPFAAPLGYTTLFISEWGRLGFNQVEFGWGPPVHMVPIPGSSIIPVGIVGSLPLPKKGVRLITWCVEENHRRPFLDLMKKLV